MRLSISLESETDIKCGIVLLHKALEMFHTDPKETPAPQETPTSQQKNIITNISWKNSSIQLDKSRWIKVKDVSNLKKGEVYNG